MAVDIHNFLMPATDFGDYTRVAEGMQREKLRNQQLAEQRNARKAATAKFLQDYLDPKAAFSGSPYDPMLAKGFSDLLQEGAALADQGADANMLMLALGPKVGQLSEYAQKAKIINQRLGEQLKTVKGKGYNLSALEQESRKTAFFNPDGSLKDIATIDPNVDYLTETVRLHPDKVTTDAGIDEFVRTAPKYTDVKDYTTYAPSGMMNRRKAEITTAPWMVQDVDEQGRPIEGFVPKFRIALENGKPKTHKFTDAKGNTVEAPVRLLDDQEFKSIMAGNPDVADYIRGLVKQNLHLAESEDVNMDSPEAMQLAQGYLYDELKRRKGGSAKDIQIQDKPSAPQIRNYFTGSPYATRGGGSGSSGSGSESTTPTSDSNEFDRIDLSEYGSPQNGRIDGFPAKSLPAQVQAILKTAGVDVSGARHFQMELKDGKVQWIAPDGKHKIDRVDMENAQKKWNSEPQKGAQPKFGPRNEQAQPKPSGGMVTFILNGKEGQIPADKAEAFQKKYPNAKRK